jgi:hypothetical protein
MSGAHGRSAVIEDLSVEAKVAVEAKTTAVAVFAELTAVTVVPVLAKLASNRAAIVNPAAVISAIRPVHRHVRLRNAAVPAKTLE